MGGPGSGRRPGGGSKQKLKLQRVATGHGKAAFNSIPRGNKMNALPKQHLRETGYISGMGWQTRKSLIKKARGYK